MNRIYRTVFNRTLRQYQVASEMTRSIGGSARVLSSLLITSLLIPLSQQALSAPSTAYGGDGGVGTAAPYLGGGTGGSSGINGATAGTVGGTAGSAPGGDGGDGADGVPGGSGGGGANGASSLGSTPISGGDGGDGGWSNNGVGGGSGAGGFGVVLSNASGSNSVSATINGGNGGSSSIGSARGGGGGGGGGTALYSETAATGTALTVNANLTGGNGGTGGGSGGGGLATSSGNGGSSSGAGGAGLSNSSGGGGGGAGAGLVFVSTASGATTVNNSASIAGGNGGKGGDQGGGNGSSGNAGAGGVGLVLEGSQITLINSASIQGGNGGDSGACNTFCSWNGGTSGAGGAGLTVSGGGNTLITSGSISGGLSGNGFSRANAVTLQDGGNTLELRQGYSFTGNVISTSGSSNGGDTLALGGSSDSTFNVSLIGGQFAGFSQYQKTGSANWTLTGTGNTNQTWQITDGTLTGTTTSIRGNVSNDGTLVFDQSSNGTYSGTLSGTGTLRKTGAGQLVLQSNANVAGVTQVQAGSMIIGGSAGSTASLSSDVDVANGALLGGHGSINGDVNLLAGSTLNPGNSIGTLTINGNTTFDASSTLEIEANSDGTTDHLTVNGNLDLGGATLSILAGTGSWAPFTTYNIVSSSNPIVGTFGAVTSNLAFLTPTLDYSLGNQVQLLLARNDIRFDALADTDNQRASAGVINSLGLSSALYRSVVALDSAAAPTAFDSLSGELHASLQSALLDDSRYLRDGLNQRLLAAQGLTASSGVLNASAHGPTFWLQGNGGWARNDGDGNAARLDHDSKGTLFGGDIALDDTWRVGAAVGLGTSDIDENDRDSSADVDSQSVALYASAKWDQLNLRLGAGRTWNDIDSRRQVNVGALNEREKASYDATVTQVFSELGYRLSVAPFQLEPFVGLAHVQLDGDSFTEKGGSAALSGNGEKQDITYSTLGLRGSVPLAQVAGLPVSAQGGLSWQHAFGGDTPDSRLAFTGGDSFQVQGTPMERNSALAELGVQAQVASNTTVGLTYSGRFGEDYRDNGIRLALSVGF